MNRDHAVPKAVCPACGYEPDRAAHLGGEDRPPESGDVSICINCGTVVLFTHDAALRLPTDEELKLIHKLDVWPRMEKIIELIHQERHEPAERP